MSMRVIRDFITSRGKRNVIVEIGEDDTLVVIRPNTHYKLGEPVEDVVGSHIIADAMEVSWCSASQAWVP